MALALVVIIGVPLVLLLAGLTMIGSAVLARRRGAVTRAAGIVLLIGGGGVLACAPLSAAGLVLDVQYGIVAFPLLGALLAVAWGVGCAIVAAVLGAVEGRRGRTR